MVAKPAAGITPAAILRLANSHPTPSAIQATKTAALTPAASRQILQCVDLRPAPAISRRNVLVLLQDVLKMLLLQTGKLAETRTRDFRARLVSVRPRMRSAGR